MLVTMTHEDLPGVEKVVDQIPYRYVWYQEGWRSDDDPTWEGAGATAPVPHASDETIHGGGQLLGRASISADSATVASATPLAVTGLSISFVCPARPFKVRIQGRLFIADSGARGEMQIGAQIGAGSVVVTGSDGHSATAASSVKAVTYSIPVPGPQVTSPNSPDWHKPTPGQTVTYTARILRPSGTGNVLLSVDNALLGKHATFIEAVTD